VEGHETSNQVEGQIPEAWVGQQVRVVCPQNSRNGVLSVGRETGSLLGVNDRGVVLAIQEDQSTRFFPWFSIYQIVREEEPGPG
jgi:hypothetical protein